MAAHAMQGGVRVAGLDALDETDALPTNGSPGDERQGVVLVKIAALLGDEFGCVEAEPAVPLTGS